MALAYFYMSLVYVLAPFKLLVFTAVINHTVTKKRPTDHYPYLWNISSWSACLYAFQDTIEHHVMHVRMFLKNWLVLNKWLYVHCYYIHPYAKGTLFVKQQHTNVLLNIWRPSLCKQYFENIFETMFAIYVLSKKLNIRSILNWRTLWTCLVLVRICC